MNNFVSAVKKALGLGGSAVARQVAKERLSIMLVHQRSNNLLSEIDMKAFQSEIQGVVMRYLKVAPDRQPQISVKPDGDLHLLEINFALPPRS